MWKKLLSLLWHVAVHPTLPTDHRCVLEDLPVPEATPHAARGQGTHKLHWMSTVMTKKKKHSTYFPLDCLTPFSRGGIHATQGPFYRFTQPSFNVTESLPLQAADRARARRTNIMLVSISVLYCLCWLPLNLFNLIVDICDVIDYDPFKVRFEIYL